MPQVPVGAQERYRVIAFALVAASFLFSTIAAQVSMRGVHEGALEIALNTAPSIRHLAAARVDLRHLHLLLDDLVDEALAGRRPAEKEVARVRREFNEELRGYLALPPARGEAPLWRALGADLDALEDAVDRLLLLVAEGDGESASGLLKTGLAATIERTTSAILRAIDHNAKEAHDRALEIEAAHGRTFRLQLGLDLASVTLAIVAVVLLNRTVRKHLELAAEHARLLERRADELEQFAGRVAHDVLGPLTTTQLALESAAMRAKSDEGPDEALAAAGLRGIRRACTIVDGLLEFARSGARPEPGARADLRAVVEDVVLDVKIVAAEAGVRLDVEEVPDRALACSPGVLTSLVANLARNAVKYIGDGPEKRVIVRARERAALARVEVEDTGPGLLPSIEGSVFEPYVRAPGDRRPGIGLGLATVKRLAQAHGGSVGVRSTPGRGCVFWFEMPLAPGDGAAASSNAAH